MAAKRYGVLLYLLLISHFAHGANLNCFHAAAAVSWSISYQIPQTQTAHSLYSDALAWTAAEDLIAAATSYGSLLTPAITGAAVVQYNVIAYSNRGYGQAAEIPCMGSGKGVFMWTDLDGVWLTHTVPQWPDMYAAAYVPPPAGKANILVCVTTPVASRVDLGTTLSYADIVVYAVKIRTNPADANVLTQIPAMQRLISGPAPTTSPYVRSLTFNIGAAQPAPAYMIVKMSKARTDVYSQYLAALLRQDMLVWSDPGSSTLLQKSCLGTYKTENIRPTSINVGGTDIKRSDDTANWAVARAPTGGVLTPLVCFIGSSRTESGKDAGTAGVCIQEATTHGLFQTIATTTTIESAC